MEPLPQIPGVTTRRRLAIGGMGELFLADEALADGARRVVVKRLLPGADATHEALFAREGDALEALSSPRIVRLLRRGPGWLLLEHVDGLDLATLLAHRARRGRPLPLSAALAAIEGLALALVDLHEARAPDGRPLGCVHRDVNPANVLVTRDGVVKLADLGVVQLDLAETPTVAGVKGTPAYMAPEQLHGRPTGVATDLYAAGLVAWELLAGRPARPLGELGLADLLAARARVPAPPSSVRAGLPAALDAAVLAALAPDPGDRPATARAWLDAVLAAVDAAPDPAALAAAVASASPGPTEAPLAPAASRPPTRAVPRAAPAAAAPRRRRSLVVLFAAVAAAAALAVVAASQRDASEPAAPAVAGDPVVASRLGVDGRGDGGGTGAGAGAGVGAGARAGAENRLSGEGTGPWSGGFQPPHVADEADDGDGTGNGDEAGAGAGGGAGDRLSGEGTGPWSGGFQPPRVADEADDGDGTGNGDEAGAGAGAGAGDRLSGEGTGPWSGGFQPPRVADEADDGDGTGNGDEAGAGAGAGAGDRLSGEGTGPWSGGFQPPRVADEAGNGAREGRSPPEDGAAEVTPTRAALVAPPRVRPPHTPPAPAPMRLEVAAADAGPVHVTGPGAQGLAPATLADLAVGGSQLLTLRGGRPSFEVRLRATRTARGVVATLAAPPGTYYRARCGARAGDTPLTRLPVGPGGLACAVTAQDDRTLAFVLRAAEARP